MMTIVSHIKVKEKHEPAWDAAMRERIEAAKEQPGFVAVQLCIPAESMNERLIIGTWETRADWEAWHEDQAFQETRERLERLEVQQSETAWHEVLLNVAPQEA